MTTTEQPVVLGPTEEERAQHLDKIRQLVEAIPVCMVTTTGADGSIHSRPMAYLHMEPDGELVFFTRAASTKALEVRRNRHVNLSFSDHAHNLYVSISGRAMIINDRERITAHFTPIMKTWFKDGAADPTLRLFVVDPQSAEYWDGPSGFSFLVSMTKSLLLTGGPKELGDHDFFEL